MEKAKQPNLIDRMKKLYEKRSFQRNFWGWVFIAPALIAFILFVLVPIILSFTFSFTNYNGISFENMRFVSFDNYAFIFKSQPRFWQGMLNIVVYTGIVVPVTLSLSMVLALLIKKPIRGTKFFRGLFYLPGITSVVASAAVFSYLLSGSGVINTVIANMNSFLGTSFKPILINSSQTALTGIILMAIWGGLGGNMILFLAGMNGIPESIYEAAEIDGAGKVRIFFQMTLPLMRPALYFALTLALIGAPQVFEPILIMNANTTTPVYEIYRNAVEGTAVGLGTAQAVLMFIAIMIVTFIMQRVSKENYF